MRLFILSVLACAATHLADAQDNFVAPTRNTIIGSSEQSYGSGAGHVFFVFNHSTVPIVAFGIAITDCENIRQACGGQRIDIPIAPGDRRQVGRVEAKDANHPWRYHWGFSYRADSSNAQIIALLREHGLSPDGEPLPPTGMRRIAVDTLPPPLAPVSPSSVASAPDPSARRVVVSTEPRDSTPAPKFRFKVAYGSILGSTMMPNAPIQLTGPCVNPAEAAGYEKDARIARTPWRPPVLQSLGIVRIPAAYRDSTKAGTDVLVRFAVDTSGATIPMSVSVLESPFGALSVNACTEAISATGTPARDRNGRAVRAWVQVPFRAVR